jgi:hypothetical protein
MSSALPAGVMMRLPRFLLVFACSVAFAATVFAGDKPAAPAQSSTQSPANQPALLPQQFGGWQMQGNAQTSKDPGAADPTSAAVLKEYGFSDLAIGNYTRDDGRTLKIRAARFEDASGAFGAYTFYLQPAMTREQIGDQGASLGQRVLFYRGHILIDALFSRESPMSGAELRELAGTLPRPSGNNGALPPVLAFLPRRNYIANTEKYAEGPQAYAAISAPLPADLVDFSVDPHVVLGQYDTSAGQATLMLIYYPNPQVAIAHLKRIDAAHQITPQQPGVAGVDAAGPFFDKRSGPIVAIAQGSLSDDDAKSLLGSVNYEANVTWNEGTDHQVRDLYSLILNIVILCAILGALAIVAGLAFGGFRILMKRIYPDKVFDRPEQMEFISLHLTEAIVQGKPVVIESETVVDLEKIPPDSR